MDTLEKVVWYFAASNFLDDAQRLAEKLLGDRRRVLGHDHPDTQRSQKLVKVRCKTTRNQKGSKLGQLIAELLGPCEDAARGALLCIGVHEDGGFSARDLEQMTSWKVGATRFTVVYSTEAMLLFENDELSGVAAYSNKTLETRASRSHQEDIVDSSMTACHSCHIRPPRIISALEARTDFATTSMPDD